MESNDKRCERDLTAEEVAEALSVNRETVYRWLTGTKATTGRASQPPILRGYNLPNRAGWRVRPEDLEAFKQARENGVGGVRAIKKAAGIETASGEES